MNKIDKATNYECHIETNGCHDGSLLHPAVSRPTLILYGMAGPLNIEIRYG